MKICLSLTLQGAVSFFLEAQDRKNETLDGGVSLLTSRFSFLTMTLSGVRGHIYRNRIKPTTPMGHLKDILKEWRSPALYLPLLAVHAGPTAIHPLYS